MYDFLKYLMRKALYNSTFSRTYEKLFKFHGILAEHFSNIKICCPILYLLVFFLSTGDFFFGHLHLLTFKRSLMHLSML